MRCGNYLQLYRKVSTSFSLVARCSSVKLSEIALIRMSGSRAVTVSNIIRSHTEPLLNMICIAPYIVTVSGSAGLQEQDTLACIKL